MLSNDNDDDEEGSSSSSTGAPEVYDEPVVEETQDGVGILASPVRVPSIRSLF
jgi:hypothetical protein